MVVFCTQLEKKLLMFLRSFFFVLDLSPPKASYPGRSLVGDLFRIHAFKRDELKILKFSGSFWRCFSDESAV